MKTAVVILADGFEEIEAITPVDLLRRGGVRVLVAALSGTRATGRNGLTVECDLALESVAPDWDLVVLPGGLPGATHLAQSPLVHAILKEGFSRNAWVGALCAAPAAVLGTLGYLKDRRFTGYPGTEADGFGGTPVVEPVVVDGNLVTSRGVGTAPAFGLRLLALLEGPETAARIARDTLLS